MSEYLGDLLADAAQRSRDVFHDVLSQVTPEQANWRPTPNANSIAWLAWHTAREQDLQIAALAGTSEVWTSQGWVERFNLDLPRNSMGYGHTPEEAVCSVRRLVATNLTTVVTTYLNTLVTNTHLPLPKTGVEPRV